MTPNFVGGIECMYVVYVVYATYNHIPAIPTFFFATIFIQFSDARKD